MEISLNVGNGLTFNGNKLTTNFDSLDHVEKTENGLSIHSTSGESGTSTTVDDITIHDRLGTGTACHVDRDRVQHIYNMSVTVVTDHSKTHFIQDDTQMKSKADVIDEINRGKTYEDLEVKSDNSYEMVVGDLFMFGPSSKLRRVPANETLTSESGVRLPYYPLLALFVVESITKEETGFANPKYRTTDISLRCLWHDPDSALVESLVDGALLT